MKRIYNYLLAAVCSVAAVSCNLDTHSPSVVDGDFVFSGIETAEPAILGAYNQLITEVNNGYVPNFTNIGSDIERCSVGNITDLVGGAQLYLEPYDEKNFNIDFQKGNWDRFYSCIFKCNSVIENIEAQSNFDEIVKTAPNDLSDLLGQAYGIRAMVYFDMTRYYGDVIYVTKPRQVINELTNRDAIMEMEIENLIRIEPYLYALGENNHLSDRVTRNFVDGMIARMCFQTAGYQTRRTDLGDSFYTDKDGNKISYEVWGTDASKNAVYNRRSDWKKFYEKAIPYLEKAVNQSAGASLTTVDPRSDSQKRTYGNPFQYYFQTVTEAKKAPETIYEITMKETGGSRIAYNFGRGSGGSSPGLPPKANAQICSYPEVYYGEYDPQDMRRDVSMSVTGSTGLGVEQLYNFNLTNRLTIGMGLNKYDLNRVETPDLRQLYSGISYIYMRQADVILMLAEAYAVTGQSAKAAAELRKVHDRAFPAAVRDQKYNELLTKVGGDIFDAIIEERKLEFQGENIRRWDLIRTGKLPEVAVSFRKQLTDHMAELKANGYVQFDNGNQLPAYVWTKLVNARAEYGYRLTAQTPEGMENDPVLYPGWRGQHDDWQAAKDYQVNTRGNAVKPVPVEDKTNLAIVGLFRYIDPASAEAAALEAEGYVKTPWAVGMYIPSGKTEPDANQEAEWSTKFMGGYTDADYAAKLAPIYLIPMESTVVATTGIKNGYGFKNPETAK